MPKLTACLASLLGLLGTIAHAQNDSAAQARSLVVDGVERQWHLFVPRSYRAGEAAPLVLEFHGTGGTPDTQAALSGFRVLAAEQGFLLVAPVAAYPRSTDGLLTWNVDLHAQAVDDVAFIADLIDLVAARYTVDRNRIYAVGFSGGARMSSRLACDLAPVVAAIGAVGGVRYPEDCEPARPVPVIAFHGRQDTVNPYEQRPDSPDYWRMGVDAAIAGWVRNNGCASQPDERAMPGDDTRVAWRNCRQGADVVLYRSATAGHTWPGTALADRLREWQGADSVSDLPATALIWAFFQEHPLPDEPSSPPVRR